MQTKKNALKKSSQEITHTLIDYSTISYCYRYFISSPLFLTCKASLKSPKNYTVTSRNLEVILKHSHIEVIFNLMSKHSLVLLGPFYMVPVSVFCSKSVDIVTIQIHHMSNIHSQLTTFSHYDNILLDCRGQLLPLFALSLKTTK